MRLVRIFIGNEEQPNRLEQEVNEWIQSTGATVLSINGNIAPQSPMSHPNARPMPSDIMLVVTYEPADVDTDSW